ALEKRRDRRYQSAGEFASDLNRYLRHEPILARPPGPVLRAGKWLRRHPVRTGFAAAFVSMVVMLVALVQSGRETQRQRDFATSRADSFQQLMYGLLRDLIEPMWEVNSPGPRPAPNDPAVARIAEAEGRAAVLGEHSEARWFTLLAAGCSYRNVSMFEDGERCLTASLDLARGFDDPEAAYQEEHTADYMVIRSAYELGRLRFWTGDLEAAEALLGQARDTSVVRDGAAGEWTFRSTAVLAQVLAAQGRAAEAEDWLRTLVATDWGSDKMLTVQARQLLGRQLLDEERLDEAAELLEPLLEDAKGVYTEKNWLHMATLVARLHDQRGRAARAAGDAAAAETEDRQAEALYVDVQARLVPLRPIAGEQLAYMLGSYGSFLITRGRLDEAREVLGEAVQVGRLSMGEDAAVTLEARGRLGVAFYQSGQSAEAEEQWRTVLESE
ncbi:MAG TPA: tetratricopeptide repeat protein, partial [Planctomycetota bacterium]|nr:tetratricopeptide repeat protein [Planctomycetota bacterium]